MLEPDSEEEKKAEKALDANWKASMNNLTHTTIRLSTTVSHPDVMCSLVRCIIKLKDFGWEKDMLMKEVSELWEVS